MKTNVVLTGLGIVVGLAIVAGGLAAWKYRAMHGPPPPAFVPVQTVNIAEARTMMWRPEADLVGTVIAIESITLSNEVPGTVTAVEFDSGAIVEKGQVLVTLDTSTEEAELRAAEATVNVAKASLESMEASQRLASANYKRVKEAAEANAAAAMDVDERKSAADTAKADTQRMGAQIEQTQAMADRVRAVIAKKTLRAPFRARAGLRNIHPGQYLKEGTEIVALQSVGDDIYLDFALPQDQAWRAHPGNVVMASSSILGDKPVEVKVVALDAEANPDTRNVRVRTIISNKSGVLRPGMFVQMRVPVGDETPQTIIPVTAIRRASFGDHVFVVQAESPPAPAGDKPGEKTAAISAPSAGGSPGGDKPRLVARQRLVTVGPRIGENVIIFNGLVPGEHVATEGSFKLSDGALVNEAPPEAPSSSSPKQPEPAVAAHD